MGTEKTEEGDDSPSGRGRIQRVRIAETESREASPNPDAGAASPTGATGRRKSLFGNASPLGQSSGSSRGRRASWVQRITGAGSREASPEPGAPAQTRRGSWMDAGSERRGSWIQRVAGGLSPAPALIEPYLGQEAHALYEHKRLHAFAMFPPDPRPELDLEPGMELDLIKMREDGWCVVRKRPEKKEYYAPGNYITVDGRTPYFTGLQSSQGPEGSRSPRGRRKSQTQAAGRTRRRVSQDAL